MSGNQLQLGVNIDHVATLRQQRGTSYPDPLQAARMAVRSGADAITLHLREDRRHIQDRDVRTIRETLDVRMNLEMAVTAEMIGIARSVAPTDCCLVPERREELTTEGGLDVAANASQIGLACQSLAKAGVRVSLFIDPDRRQAEMAWEVGAPVIELHTGAYADADSDESRARELERIIAVAGHAQELGLQVNAGHGLNYDNVQAIAAIPVLRELNIGHSIIARAVFVGLEAAVRDMKRLMREARQ